MVSRVHMTDADRARIAAAVAAAETETCVEIRLVLAQHSGHYTEYELIYPALLALIVGGITTAVLPDLSGGWLFLLEGAVFVVAALALQWTALRIALVPSPIKRKAAWRQARLHYAGLGLQHLRTHNAVLLFCSAAEHYVEVLVDDAIAEKLPEATWKPIVARFTEQFAKGAVADAFVEAAGACATAASMEFPHKDGDANELSDQLIEL